MVKKLLLVVAVLALGAVLLIASRPSSYVVERKTTIEAPVELVFEWVDELRNWEQWSPWEKLDPAMTKVYEGPARGVDASFGWEGDQRVGKGRLTIVESIPAERIELRLEFFEPWESVNNAIFTFSAADEGESEVSWRTSGEMNFSAKAAALFIDMDEMLGADLASGLEELKRVTEAEAVRRAEEAERIRVAAALAAAEEAEAEAAQAEADAEQGAAAAD